MLSFLHPLSLSLTVRRRRRRRMKMSILPDAYSHSLAFTGRGRRRRVRKSTRRKFSRFLPEEIMENIFTRLPVKSIIRFRCVSKFWRHRFQNPNFIKNHLNHAIGINKFNILLTNVNYFSVLLSTSSPFLSHALKIDYPCTGPVEVPRILGSSQGLVCIQTVHDRVNSWIWNPATREYKLVPETLADPEDDTIALGFGFDCKNDDYKFLKIVRFEGDDAVSEARLYSLASNSWKSLGTIPYDFPFCVDKGFLLNGVLHWVATDLRTKPKSAVIVCFDISDETFCDVSLPPPYAIDIDKCYVLYLGVWEGKICLLHQNHMEEDPNILCAHQNDHTDVWTMMNNKWSKHWKITANLTNIIYYRIVETLQNGEILFEGESMEHEDGRITLISYDPKLERARALNIQGFPTSCEDTEMETYIETLVALNSGTYVGQ